MDHVNDVSASQLGRPLGPAGRAPIQDLSKIASQLAIRQVAEERAAEAVNQEFMEEGGFGNTLQRFNRNIQTLQERVRSTKAGQANPDEKVVAEAVEAVSEVDDASSRFHDRNPELLKNSLELLHARCQSAETAEEILEIVQEFYADPSLADEAMIFLAETTTNAVKRALVEEARSILNKRYEKEIRSGRNIQSTVQKYAASGLDQPSSLRSLYRDVVDTHREPAQLFEELAKRFTYDELKQVIKFLIHCLNNELKDSVLRPERNDIVHLMGECRVLSAILGVYYFFASRQKELLRQFTTYGLKASKELYFENLARMYCRFVDDRYPIAEKVLQSADKLMLAGNLVGQTLVFNLFEQAVDFTAPRLYRTPQAREDLQKAFQKAVEMVDAQLEEQTREGLRRLRQVALQQRAEERKRRKAQVKTEEDEVDEALSALPHLQPEQPGKGHG
ncbi:MAG: HrpJ domain-containing protein [Chlamydiia bacterium]